MCWTDRKNYSHFVNVDTTYAAVLVTIFDHKNLIANFVLVNNSRMENSTFWFCFLLFAYKKTYSCKKTRRIKHWFLYSLPWIEIRMVKCKSSLKTVVIVIYTYQKKFNQSGILITVKKSIYVLNIKSIPILIIYFTRFKRERELWCGHVVVYIIFFLFITLCVCVPMYFYL